MDVHKLRAFCVCSLLLVLGMVECHKIRHHRIQRILRTGWRRSASASHKTVKKTNEENRTTLGGNEVIMKHNWYFKNQEACLAHLGTRAHSTNGKLHCNGTFDSILCWPAQPANSTARLHCPPMRGLNPLKYATRRCGENGRWLSKDQTEDPLSQKGWTDFMGCYTDFANRQKDKFFGNKSDWERQMMRDILTGTRHMEMVGLCLSLVSLTLSLIIFCYFRSLKCNRTRIHRNLFIAVIVQVIIQLILYVDQYVHKTKNAEVGGTIYETPIVCEALYVLMEYTILVKFMWMLIEGLYLHNMIAISVFSGKPNYILYYSIGWGVPVAVTLAWAITTGLKHHERCWWGYNFKPIFWIIEGPRAAVIVVNIIFLLNIIRVLVTKLRESHSTEALQVRKAVKAAIVLLPLLGITNFIQLLPEPTDSAVKFGIWSFSSHFLITFQGFFIALLYCFLNGEVQSTVKKHWDRYRQSRGGRYTSGKRRLSRTFSVFTSVTEMPPTQSARDFTKYEQVDAENLIWLGPMKLQYRRSLRRLRNTIRRKRVTPNNNGSLSNGHPPNTELQVDESMV